MYFKILKNNNKNIKYVNKILLLINKINLFFISRYNGQRKVFRQILKNQK
jgi:hypothetical protein